MFSYGSILLRLSRGGGFSLRSRPRACPTKSVRLSHASRTMGNAAELVLVVFIVPNIGIGVGRTTSPWAVLPVHRRYDIDDRMLAIVCPRNDTAALRGETHVSWGTSKVGRMISGSLCRGRFAPSSLPLPVLVFFWASPNSFPRCRRRFYARSGSSESDLRCVCPVRGLSRDCIRLIAGTTSVSRGHPHLWREFLE